MRCCSVAICVAVTLLLSSAGCQKQLDLKVAGTVDRAQQTFDQAESKADFLLAASQYQAILERGVVSGAVLFNQGNAYMRAGERGRAIACYRRAKRYRPRDPYLDANLRVALGAEATGQERRLTDFLLFWQDWISYPGKFRLTGALGALTFLLAIAALVGRQRWWMRLTIASLLVTLLMAGSSAYDWYRYESVIHGVVITDDVVARKGNAVSYEPAFTEPLSEGTEFHLVERRGDWLLIGLRSGPEAWVQESSVQTY